MLSERPVCGATGRPTQVFRLVQFDVLTGNKRWRWRRWKSGARNMQAYTQRLINVTFTSFSIQYHPPRYHTVPPPTGHIQDVKPAPIALQNIGDQRQRTGSGARWAAADDTPISLLTIQRVSKAVCAGGGPQRSAVRSHGLCRRPAGRRFTWDRATPGAPSPVHLHCQRVAP